MNSPIYGSYAMNCSRQSYKNLADIVDKGSLGRIFKSYIFFYKSPSFNLLLENTQKLIHGFLSLPVISNIGQSGSWRHGILWPPMDMISWMRVHTQVSSYFSWDGIMSNSPIIHSHYPSLPYHLMKSCPFLGWFASWSLKKQGMGLCKLQTNKRLREYSKE